MPILLLTLDSQGDNPMLRHLAAGAVFAFAGLVLAATDAAAQPPNAGTQAYGGQWGYSYNTSDWNRLYHYPYVWYPQNFYQDGYYQSANDLYYRYPQEMRVPVYNRAWQNDYPKSRRYYQGHHFHLDVF
ncbi:MAG: calmodulin-binding protein [Planctomycetaceae bacterium]